MLRFILPDDFVVTGTARKVRKFDSAFTISSVSEEKIELASPVGAVDLMRTLPGFATEPSGGESGNNVAVRGLPTTNFRFVGLFEDGLPNFFEQQQDFVNADELMRVDATIEGVEAVRGGTASIFSSNSPGANV
ncbi:MAG TPA: Plug domain-containing protein, partial [Opitutaceae bacterium]